MERVEELDELLAKIRAHVLFIEKHAFYNTQDGRTSLEALDKEVGRATKGVKKNTFTRSPKF